MICSRNPISTRTEACEVKAEVDSHDASTIERRSEREYWVIIRTTEWRRGRRIYDGLHSLVIQQEKDGGTGE